jgi:hypothetical protein
MYSVHWRVVDGDNNPHQTETLTHLTLAGQSHTLNSGLNRVPGPQGRLGPGQWKNVLQVLSKKFGCTPAPTTEHRQSSLSHPLMLGLAGGGAHAAPQSCALTAWPRACDLSTAIPTAVPAEATAARLPTALDFATAAAFLPAMHRRAHRVMQTACLMYRERDSNSLTSMGLHTDHWFEA